MEFRGGAGGRPPFWPILVGVCCLALSLLASLWGSALAAEPTAVCKPGVVRRDGRFTPVSWTPVSAPVPEGSSVRLRYLAHSSFLVTDPGGGRALMDPYATPTVTPLPDAVTVSNFHETHSQTGPYEGKTTVLYGVTAEGRPNPIDRTFRGLRVAAFPQVGGEGGNPFVVNTIFVFQSAGICIAHFGNARFGPSMDQIRSLGKIHVLLIPIDGSFTVPHEIAAKVVKRIGPNIVIPMHYFGPELPVQFGAALRAEGIDKMVRPPSDEIVLSSRRLPPPTVYMVMPNAEIP